MFNLLLYNINMLVEEGIVVEVPIDQEVVVAEQVLIILRFAILGIHPRNESFDRRVVLCSRDVVLVFYLSRNGSSSCCH